MCTIINGKEQFKTVCKETAKIKKVDITFAAHCHNVNVLLSNISHLTGQKQRI